MITNLKLLANSLKSYMSTTSQKPDQIIYVHTTHILCQNNSGTEEALPLMRWKKRMPKSLPKYLC